MDPPGISYFTNDKTQLSRAFTHLFTGETLTNHLGVLINPHFGSGGHGSMRSVLLRSAQQGCRESHICCGENKSMKDGDKDGFAINEDTAQG